MVKTRRKPGCGRLIALLAFLITSSSGAALVFPGSGVGAIPDGVVGSDYGAPLNITFNVTNVASPISHIAVDLTMTHTRAGDLDARLIAPNGTELILFSRIGVLTGTDVGSPQNFDGRYIFADTTTGSNIWTVATSPSCDSSCVIAAGTYRTTAAGGAGQTNPAPVTSLITTFGNLSANQINGQWTLRIRDGALHDTGSVSAANLVFPETHFVTHLGDSGPGSLRQALADASGDAAARDKIQFLLFFFNPLTIELTSQAELLVNKNVDIVGPGANLLTISGGGTNRYRSVFSIGTNVNVKMSGLTISNGLALSVADSRIFGGGIFLFQSVLELKGCKIVENAATMGGGIASAYSSLTLEDCFLHINAAAQGGGIWAYNSEVTMRNSTVFYNLVIPYFNPQASPVSDLSGSGIASLALGGSNAVLSLDACRISTNDWFAFPLFIIPGFIPFPSSTFTIGGGIFNYADGSSTARVTITDSEISGNRAVQGGGVYNLAESGGKVPLLVSSSIIAGNMAVGDSIEQDLVGIGGGLFNRSSDGGPGATVSNCVITSNSCDLGFGGGIYNEGNLSLFDCTLNGNWVSGTPDSHGNLNGLGGGIHNNSATAGRTLLLSGCTISSNSASILGGGIANIGPSDGSVLSLALVSSTFSGNSAAQGGGGLYNGNYHFATTSAGTIIVNTIMDSSSITNAGGIVASLGNNLSSDHGGGLLSHPTDQTSTPPMLGPLQNNGGQAFTHAPLPGSPAIDKGKNFNGAATDQRGFARTINMAGIPDAANGDGTDIGAVEWQDASPRLVNAGIVSNQFGFNVTGPFTNIVLEYSTDPGTNWTVLGTYPLSDSVLRYNEFTPPVQPKRFYRARIQ